ncbi:hypothetical protein ECT92401_2660 [Escherichia coli T924_01]|nr:hypothetical protein ECT92401_2660 [Escherichia coli T924_01]
MPDIPPLPGTASPFSFSSFRKNTAHRPARQVDFPETTRGDCSDLTDSFRLSS